MIWLDVDITNNDPNLICSYFLSEVEKLELVPRVVRIDKGTENIHISDVQTLLRMHHDDDHVNSCVMVGSSNHNQRIERWWGYCRKALLQNYIDLFKDLVLSGILQMGNLLHTQCLKFCFMNTLRKELNDHADLWNGHRVRQTKSASCPSGVPNFLFHYPEYYDSSNQGKPVNMATVATCKQLYTYERSDFGSDDIFSEWALGVMLRRGWTLPITFADAFDLFSKLIEIIIASDN